jgi:hypothetical protein
VGAAGQTAGAELVREGVDRWPKSRWHGTRRTWNSVTLFPPLSPSTSLSSWVTQLCPQSHEADQSFWCLSHAEVAYIQNTYMENWRECDLTLWVQGHSRPHSSFKDKVTAVQASWVSVVGSHFLFRVQIISDTSPFRPQDCERAGHKLNKSFSSAQRPTTAHCKSVNRLKRSAQETNHTPVQKLAVLASPWPQYSYDWPHSKAMNKSPLPKRLLWWEAQSRWHRLKHQNLILLVSKHLKNLAARNVLSQQMSFHLELLFYTISHIPS